MWKIKNRNPLIILIIVIAFAIIVYSLGTIINVTPSIKEGVYIRSYGKIKSGDLVAFCLNDPYKTIGLKNYYLESGYKCNGSAPLIKEIIAIPGDQVILKNDYIQVNNKIYPYKTKFFDSIGRRLSTYPRGKYVNTNGYWLIGTNSTNSWDSRYWGYIFPRQILYKVIPIITFP